MTWCLFVLSLNHLSSLLSVLNLLYCTFGMFIDIIVQLYSLNFEVNYYIRQMQLNFFFIDFLIMFLSVCLWSVVLWLFPKQTWFTIWYGLSLFTRLVDFIFVSILYTYSSVVVQEVFLSICFDFCSVPFFWDFF